MPDAKTPALDLAVPYAAPKLLKTIAATHPMALKKGCAHCLAVAAVAAACNTHCIDRAVSVSPALRPMR